MDQSGAFMLTVDYGIKPLEIRSKRSSIEVGAVEQLVQTLRGAVLAGELDAVLFKAKGQRLGLRKQD